MTGAVEVGPGRFTVPQNRWDLLAPPIRPPSVSVVVPFYDQQADLDRLLVGMELQHGGNDVREVVVVDDGSPVGPCLPHWYDGPPVVVLRQPDRGFRAGAARNLGAARATGDVLVFLDADMVPTPKFVRQMVEIPAVAPEAVVVGTRQHWDLEGWTPTRVRRWLCGGRTPPRLDDPSWLRDGYERTGDLLELTERSYQWVISAALAVPRPWFEELGGFDESICAYGGEDWDLAYRAQNAGAVMARSHAVAHHNGADWAGRAGQDGVKERERRNLVARIPGRDDPLIGRYASVVLHLDASDQEADDVLACVATALAAEPTCVAVSITGLPEEASTLFENDSRVHLGPPPSRVTERALVTVRVLRPVHVGAEAVDRILARLAPGGPARLVVVDEDGEALMICTSTRAEQRVARWAPLSGQDRMRTRLFGLDGRCHPRDLDLQVLAAPVDLVRMFPR